MQKLLEMLAEHGVTVPEDKQTELKSALAQNYKHVAEFNKKISRLELERDNWKEQAETSANTLKSFEGVDLKKIEAELEEWKTKAANAKTEMEQKLQERDFADALKEKMSAYKFTSEAAKRDVMAQIKSANLNLNNGEIVGLTELMEKIKGADASAFVDEEAERLEKNKAKFTAKKKGGGGGTLKLSDLTLDERIALKAKDPDLYAALKNG